MNTSGRKYMSKRQRACDFCRSRKSACQIDQALPCRLCASRGRTCTFQDEGPSRKRAVVQAETTRLNDTTPPQANSVSDQAPSETQNLFNALEDMTDALPSEILEMLGHNLMDVGDTSAFLDDWNPLTPGVNSAPQSVENRFVDANATLTPQVIGASGDLEPCLLESYQFDESQTFCFQKLTIQSAQQGTDPVQFLLSDPILYESSKAETRLVDVSMKQLQQRLEAIVSVNQGVMLVRLFQEYVAPLFPIFSANFPPQSSCSPPYLLAALYSCVQQFVKFDGDLAVELAYKGFSSAELVKIAWTALNAELHTPTIHVLQTLLLLLIRPSATTNVTEAPFRWTVLGNLVTCGQTLGLQYDAGQWSGTAAQKAQRQRLSFLIYAADKWMACSLGRPPLIHRDNWMISSVPVESFLDSGLDEAQQQSIMQFSDLTDTLTRVLQSMYSIRALSSADYTSALTTARPFLGELSQWRERMKTSTDSSDTEAEVRLTARIPTELGHYYTTLNVFRAIVRQLCSHRKSGAILDSHFLDAERNARIGLRSCTSGFLSFIQSLPQDMVRTFWPHWANLAISSLCHVILLMVVTSESFEEASSWSEDLRKARTELRVKASMHPLFHLASIRIDSIFWKDITKVIHLEPHMKQALRLPTRQT